MRSAPVLLHRENVQVTFQKGKKLKLVISGEDSYILQFHGKLLNSAIFVIKVARFFFLYQSFTAFEFFPLIGLIQQIFLANHIHFNVKLKEPHTYKSTAMIRICKYHS